MVQSDENKVIDLDNPNRYFSSKMAFCFISAIHSGHFIILFGFSSVLVSCPNFLFIFNYEKLFFFLPSRVRIHFAPFSVLVWFYTYIYKCICMIYDYMHTYIYILILLSFWLFFIYNISLGKRKKLLHSNLLSSSSSASFSH